MSDNQNLQSSIESLISIMKEKEENSAIQKLAEKWDKQADAQMKINEQNEKRIYKLELVSSNLKEEHEATKKKVNEHIEDDKISISKTAKSKIPYVLGIGLTGIVISIMVSFFLFLNKVLELLNTVPVKP